MRWTVVIPAKALPAAKSRLRDASQDDDEHRRLVEAVRADTVAAARSAAGVARVLVVRDRPEPDGDPMTAPGEDPAPVAMHAMVQRTAGLNGALADAANDAARAWPLDGVVALVGDLPALRPDDLAAVLVEAAHHRRAYVADAAGTGTTLLAAVPGTELAPAFGAESAARHAERAVALEAAPGLRHDVDTAADLRSALRLGVGVATAAVLGVEPAAAMVAGRSPGRGMMTA